MRSMQHAYIRRMLGLNKRSSIAVLFTETGLWPIRYRRISLALRYLAYILRERLKFALLALQEAISLCIEGKTSWMSDLVIVLQRLPVPIVLSNLDSLSVQRVQSLTAMVESSMSRYLEELIECSPKLVLLHNRLEYLQKERAMVHRTLAFRDYLQVFVPEHRKALARLACSDHPLAIEPQSKIEPTSSILNHRDLSGRSRRTRSHTVRH